MHTTSVLSDLAITIDVSDIIAGVDTIIGVDKVAAYQQYNMLRAEAQSTMQMAKDMDTDAEYCNNLLKDAYNQVISTPSVKEVLRVAYAGGDEQRVHDEIRAQIIQKIVAADPRFNKYMDDTIPADKTLLQHIVKSADEARRTAKEMYSDADKILKEAGLGSIVETRKAASDAKTKKK